MRKGWTHVIPDDVKRALQSLTTPLPVRMRPQRLMHDPTLLMEAYLARAQDADRQAHVRP